MCYVLKSDAIVVNKYIFCFVYLLNTNPLKIYKVINNIKIYFDDSTLIYLFSGVTFSLLSGACFTGSNFLIKEFSADVSDVVLVRYVLQIIILSTVIFCMRERVWPQKTSDRFLTICQGLTGSMNVITGVAYVSFMPVADGLTLVFCSPAVTILLSTLVLGDKLTLAKTVSAIALVSGALLVCQPPAIFGSGSQWDAGYMVGVGLASTSCVTGGLTIILIAKAQVVK